jgi:DNA-binding transcriptional ArsR family regulator
MPPIAILIALADTTRCRIIEILRDGPQPVHVLTASFAISRPAISRHLRVLKTAGLISEKKQGRENRYALHPARLAPIGRWLADMQGSATPVVQSIPQEPPAAKPRKTLPQSQMGFDF